MDTSKIEKKVTLRAPRAKVWRALTNAKEFGTWFGAVLEGAFAPGAKLRGRITSPGYDHMILDIAVEQVEPERMLSYRWHPYPNDPKVDYSKEPTTLVEFHLEEISGGTALTVIESGFDSLPLARRAEAFRAHDEGWVEQAKSIEHYVAQP